MQPRRWKTPTGIVWMCDVWMLLQAGSRNPRYGQKPSWLAFPKVRCRTGSANYGPQAKTPHLCVTPCQLRMVFIL